MAVKKIKPTENGIPEEAAEEFSETAAEIVRKGIKLLNRRFDRALYEEDALDALIEGVLGSSELTQTEKNKLAQNIRALQLYDIKAIVSIVASLYEKSAGSGADEDIKIDIMLPEGASDYAE